MHALLDGATAGDPMCSVKWTRKSTRVVARCLRVSPSKAWRMLRKEKYRLRFNRKRLYRKTHPERDKQFRYINRLRRDFKNRGDPVISVDAKKRELVGLFRNGGRAWRQDAIDVSVYDFPSDAQGVAIPYGIYDDGRGDGFVVVGTSHNTAEFATHAIRTWWMDVGRKQYQKSKRLLILADSGSSNAARATAWKLGLQTLADKFGLNITVAHYPTGASKWNPVEHRLFGPISINWSGQPLKDYSTILGHIRQTRTTSGRKCRARIDRQHWPTKSELEAAGKSTRLNSPLRIRHARVLSDLNYTVLSSLCRRRCPT